jgi:hypothetical protein
MKKIGFIFSVALSVSFSSFATAADSQQSPQRGQVWQVTTGVPSADQYSCEDLRSFPVTHDPNAFDVALAAAQKAAVQDCTQKEFKSAQEVSEENLGIQIGPSDGVTTYCEVEVEYTCQN